MLAELFHMTTTIWTKTPYNKAFIAVLKAKIPKDYRYWDKDERVWVVNYSYEKDLIALCYHYFDDVVHYGEKRYTNAIQSSPNYENNPKLYLYPLP